LSRQLTATTLALLLAGGSLGPPAFASPAPPEGCLAAGIELVEQGDFENATRALETCVLSLETDTGQPSPDLARAYLYLGIAYLETDQELSARSRFRQAAARDPEMTLDPHEFSPQVIRFFDSARREAREAVAAADAGRPAAEEARPEKKGRSVWPFVVLGGGAAAGIAVATGGGGPATTQGGTTTAPGAAAGSLGETVRWTSDLDVPGARVQMVLNGAEVSYQGRGSGAFSGAALRGGGRIEGLLVSADGRAGTWRIRLTGSFKPGSLRVVAGEAVALTADTVVFRLAGRPGERVVLTFQAPAS
jgi:hypothetical protein